MPPLTFTLSTTLLACAGAALPLDAAATARTTVGRAVRAAEGVNARIICTTLRWRLMIVAYLLGADGARVVSDVDA